MRTLAAFAVGAMALGLASTANAQWYVGVGGGAVLMEDPTTDISCFLLSINVSVNQSRNRCDPTFKAHTDTGWAANGNLGYAGLFIPNIRVEGEVAYRSNHVNGIEITPPSVTFPATGHINSLAFMANGYYDFLNSTPFTPYLGGGVGAARVSLDNLAFTAL